MKKKIGLLILIILPLLLVFGLYFYSPTIELKESNTLKVIDREEEFNYEEYINSLKVKYNNTDVIGIIRIPNVLEEPLVQTDNNDYYLHYDVYKKENINGASFLDYRTNIKESKKLLIYGHSNIEGTVPFVKITGYNDKDFMDKNPYIYLIDSNGSRKYEVFSSYIENKDFDYVNLNSFGGLTYKEHLEKLRNKSFVKKEIELEEESKVLILQTCSFDQGIVSNRYQIVVAKEVK